MRNVPLARASRSLAKYAAELKDEIVVVTKGRRAVAALVPLKNVDRETLALSAHPEFLALVRKARVEIAAGRDPLARGDAGESPDTQEGVQEGLAADRTEAAWRLRPWSLAAYRVRAPRRYAASSPRRPQP